MSSSERYEQRLPTLLEELAAPRTPAYFDDILGQVSRTRQRPGWTFPERWLPMSAVSERLATVPRVPIRAALVVVLVLIALAVGLVLIVGSQRLHVPAPFGPAANGLIAYVDTDGAIRTGYPATGQSTVIVPGSGHQRPVFSPDGRRLAYLQARAGAIDIGAIDIVVAGVDGSAPLVLTRDPLGNIGHFGWSPDSHRVVAAVPPNQLLTFELAAAGTPTVLMNRQFTGLDSFDPGLSDLFRPPTGAEILYVGSGADGSGLYRQSLSGGDPTPVLTARRSPIQFSDMAAPQWSPDGNRIAVTLRYPDNPDLGRVYVMNADGTGLRRLTPFEVPGHVIDEEHLAWSPDGTRIAFARWINDVADGSVDVRPLTIVNVAAGTETELPNIEVNGYNGWAWAPDGASIIEVPGGQSQYDKKILVIDATSGKVSETGWTSPDAASWQRTAPER